MNITVIEPLGVPATLVEAKLKEVAPSNAQITVYTNRTNSQAELKKRGENADIVVVANQPLSAEVILSWHRLRLLNVAFTGLDHIDLDACKCGNIAVMNAAGYSTESVSELVFGMIFSLFRNIAQCDSATRASKTKDGLVGFELCGKTVGVIGLGAIGTKVAHIAKAFGAKVVAYSRTPKRIEGITEVANLSTLLEQSDIVSIHLPKTPATVNLISKTELALMKRSAILINTARGTIVNEADLACALNTDLIAGAGVDVFEMEPPIPSDHPLLHAKNTLLTPHVAFATAESMQKRLDIVAHNIKAFLETSNC